MSNKELKRMTKIEGNDTTQSMLMKMSEGNPGGLTVCIRLLKEGENIDTKNFLGGLGHVLALDTEGIYGSRIWMLYKDVCKEELWKVVAVLRACQLGLLDSKDLNYAIANYGKGIDVDDVVEKVKEQLGDAFVIPEDSV